MNRNPKVEGQAMTNPLKWHGGKTYLAPWIIEHFPNREQYTHYAEPYAGGLAVLFLHDPNGKSESVNDLNKELTIFWLTLIHTPEPLLRALWCTPLSQEVWEEAKQTIAGETWEIATAFFIRYRQSRQGLGKDYCTPTTRTRRGMNENVSGWLSAIEGLPEAHERLRRVEVRNMDAVDFIKQYDHDKALFYLDPPYMHETRVTTKEYAHEMTPADHKRLLDCLTEIKGKFCLSGYDNPLYYGYSFANNWNIAQKEIDNKASSKKTKETKVETLWMNY